MEMIWNQERESIIAAAELGDAPAKTAVALLVDARKRAHDAQHTARHLHDELATLKAAHAWIKTSERMPDSKGNYLAVSDGEIVKLEYIGDNESGSPWVDDFSLLHTHQEVSHWMPFCPEVPLPEAPK